MCVMLHRALEVDRLVCRVSRVSLSVRHSGARTPAVSVLLLMSPREHVLDGSLLQSSCMPMKDLRPISALGPPSTWLFGGPWSVGA